MLRPMWAAKPVPSRVLADTSFAYKGFGHVTFHRQAHGTLPSLEWWSYLFTRVEE